MSEAMKGNKKEKVLAVAAGHEITEDELDKLIANYPPEEQVYLSNPKARDQVLDQLIAFHLFAKMAEEERIMETEAYKTMIEKMKVELASHMAATSVVEHITVIPEEERSFYEENKAQFVQGPKVSAKHILVDTLEQAEKIAGEIGRQGFFRGGKGIFHLSLQGSGRRPGIFYHGTDGAGV